MLCQVQRRSKSTGVTICVFVISNLACPSESKWRLPKFVFSTVIKRSFLPPKFIDLHILVYIVARKSDRMPVALACPFKTSTIPPPLLFSFLREMGRITRLRYDSNAVEVLNGIQLRLCSSGEQSEGNGRGMIRPVHLSWVWSWAWKQCAAFVCGETLRRDARLWLHEENSPMAYSGVMVDWARIYLFQFC
jgi:hypothetical protein